MNIAFAGLRHGHIFSLLQMAEANPDTTISGLWEQDPAALASARQRFSGPVYESYEALLDDKTVEIVAIGDYYGIRGQRVLQALRAGKHVICDKPICTRLDELDEIERLSVQKGLQVGCMLSLRYDPALRLARKLVSEGALGEIHDISFTGQHPLQYGKRPGWYFEEGKHGGTINDIAIHGVDAVAMVTGLRFDKTICARQWNAFADKEPAFADCAQFLARYENGAGLTADVSYSAPDNIAFELPSYWRFQFWGTKGMIECRFGDAQILYASSAGKQILPVETSQDDELCELLRAIRAEETFLPASAMFDSARVALTIQAAADEFVG